jgi:hypothetical protein
MAAFLWAIAQHVAPKYDPKNFFRMNQNIRPFG